MLHTLCCLHHFSAAATAPFPFLRAACVPSSGAFLAAPHRVCRSPPLQMKTEPALTACHLPLCSDTSNIHRPSPSIFYLISFLLYFSLNLASLVFSLPPLRPLNPPRSSSNVLDYEDLDKLGQQFLQGGRGGAPSHPSLSSSLPPSQGTSSSGGSECALCTGE